MGLPEHGPAPEEEERLEEAEAAFESRSVEGDGVWAHGTSLSLAAEASARKNSRDFVSVSPHSRKGSESHTIPPPEWYETIEPSTTAVRMATLKTAFPSPRT